MELERLKTKPKGARVCIGIPAYRAQFHPLMVASTDALVRKSHHAGIELVMKRRYGSVIPVERNAIVESAKEVNATHLLFIDADMTFEDDCLIRLLRHNVDIVSGLCVARHPPYHPVAKRLTADGSYQNIRKEATEGGFIDDLDGVGAAFLLIKMHVFDTITRPYFAMPPFFNGVMGEDIYFCQQARQAGFKVCMDCDMIIGHMGDHPFTIKEYAEYQDAYEEQEAAKKESAKVAVA